MLAVDPSSPFSGGAILGDRVRMQDHALDPGVFIRSMATRGHLGGLAVAVPEAIRVFAAAGIPLVLVETVGVGQVEVEVAAATDTTVVVVNPKWGDAIQANKAGLLETADIFVINKADMPGAARPAATSSRCSTCPHPGTGDPPSSRRWPPPGRASTRCGPRSAATERLSRGGTAPLERMRRRAARARVPRRPGGPHPRGDRRLRADGDFAELDRAVAEHRLDPYDAAEQLLALRWRRGPSASARPPGSVRRSGAGRNPPPGRDVAPGPVRRRPPIRRHGA